MKFRALHKANLRDGHSEYCSCYWLCVRYSYCAGGHDKRDTLHPYMEQTVRLFLGFRGTRRLNTVFTAAHRWTHCFEPLSHFYHVPLWSALVLCFLPSYFIPQFLTSIVFPFIFFSMRATFPPLSSLEVSEELVASAVKILPIIQVSPLAPHFHPFRGTCPVAG